LEHPFKRRTPVAGRLKDNRAPDEGDIFWIKFAADLAFHGWRKAEVKKLRKS